MTQGLYASVSGIRANQTRLDVISNNISNVNTTGFKSSSVNFGTIFYNTYSGGSAPTGTQGGTNPLQSGNGVYVTDVASNFGQGATQFTGRNTDMLINGEGFFVVERKDQNLGLLTSDYYLTRAGNFSLDSQGSLVTSGGDKVRGSSQLSGSSSATINNVKIPLEMTVVKYTNNTTNALVSMSVAEADTASGSITAAPAGQTRSISQVRLTTFTVGTEGGIVATYSNGDRVTVRTDASTVSASDPTLARREIIVLPAEGGTYASYNYTGGAADGQISQVSGFEVFHDGSGAATLRGMELQIQTATVINPGGLIYAGSNNFQASANSGITGFGVPASENRGQLQVGALESSNVDLAGEFTNMIVTQRALEANSKVIRTQSDVLQSIINII